MAEEIKENRQLEFWQALFKKGINFEQFSLQRNPLADQYIDLAKELKQNGRFSNAKEIIMKAYEIMTEYKPIIVSSQKFDEKVI